MINSNPTLGSIMKEVILMNNNKLSKQQAQLEKLNALIKEEKNNIDKKLGHQLINKFNLEYTKLDKDYINNFVNELFNLYQNNVRNNE